MKCDDCPIARSEANKAEEIRRLMKEIKKLKDKIN